MTNVNNDYVYTKKIKISLIKKNQRSALVNDSVMRNYVERHMGHFQ